jgi:hypothetical protein
VLKLMGDGSLVVRIQLRLVPGVHDHSITEMPKLTDATLRTLLPNVIEAHWLSKASTTANHRPEAVGGAPSVKPPDARSLASGPEQQSSSDMNVRSPACEDLATPDLSKTALIGFFTPP